MPSVCVGVPDITEKMMINILQLNLDHYEAAQDLLMQTVCEQKIEVAIIAVDYP